MPAHMKSPVKILICEDEAATLLWFKDLFQKAGYEVAMAFSEQEAFAALICGQPGAAVLDIRLRTGDSLGVARELMRLGVPVLFVSGQVGPLAIPRDFREVPFLSKPVENGKLVSMVKELVEAA